jgi:hypothetical protein
MHFLPVTFSFVTFSFPGNEADRGSKQGKIKKNIRFNLTSTGYKGIISPRKEIISGRKTFFYGRNKIISGRKIFLSGRK